MHDFLTDYLAEKAELMAAFAGSPRALFNAPPKTGPWDPALVEAITEYQTVLGGRPLFMGDEAAIITGQQPGLLAGPLYTIYKAATAILLAKKIQQRFGTRCVPVFWVASDDHDFEESQTAYILTRSHELLPITYDPPGDVNGLPMYRVPLAPSLHETIEKAASQAAGSEFRSEMEQFLHESLDASQNMADWMARVMVRLFQRTPLLVFAPHLPVARKLAVPIIEKEITDPLVSTMLLNDMGERLRENGYHQQVVKGPDECNFFLEVNGLRRKVVFQDDRYILPEEASGTTRYTIDELAAILEAAPERFSANVALRCIVQQQLFPAIAYVGGPGELAYWAQLKPLFRHFRKEMPAFYPRARAVLTDSKTNQLMEKLQLTRDELAGPPEELINRALRTAPPSPAQEVVQAHRPRVLDALGSLEHAIEPHNKPAAQMARSLRERTGAELERMEQVIAKNNAVQAEAVKKQVNRLCNTLCPLRKPQERVLNVFSFMFEYGWELIPRIIKELDVDSFAMKEIEL